MMTNSVSKRKVHLDIFRFIAMFLVMYGHTGNKAMNHYLVEGDAFSYYFCIAFHVITIASPSMFFFISGGLLLGKEESIKDVLKKRILRYAIVLVSFKVLQLVYTLLTNPDYLQNPAYQTNPVKTFFGVVYTQHVVAQYWFLAYYMAFLILLPLLRILARNMQDKHFMYLIVIYFIFEVALVIFEFFMEYDRIDLYFPLFDQIVIKPLIGYFVITRLGDKVNDKKFLLCLNGAGLIFYVFNIYYSHRILVETGSLNTLEGLMLFTALIVYCDVKFISDKLKLGEKRFASFISFCAAGGIVTYLLDPQLHRITEFVYDKSYMTIKWFPAGILWTVCALAIGIPFAWLLRKIPYVGRLFGGK